MKETRTHERTTLNGITWFIVADNFGAAREQYSGYTFRTIEEAQAHLNAVDERVTAPREVAALDCNSFYGRGSNVYYGD